MYVFNEIEKIYFGYKITANVHDIRDRSQIVLKIEKKLKWKIKIGKPSLFFLRTRIRYGYNKLFCN